MRTSRPLAHESISPEKHHRRRPRWTPLRLRHGRDLRRHQHPFRGLSPHSHAVGLHGGERPFGHRAWFDVRRCAQRPLRPAPVLTGPRRPLRRDRARMRPRLGLVRLRLVPLPGRPRNRWIVRHRPMYIAEIAPAAKRGRLVGLLQFNIVAGILIAYLSNYAIGTLGLVAEEWRWKLAVPTLPAVFFFITLFGIPQSPRWLIRRGYIEEARQIFTRIGEPDPDRAVPDAIRSVKSEDRTKVEPLFQRKYRRPIMLAIAIGFFNQMSGINAILYYLNDTFKSAGF